MVDKFTDPLLTPQDTARHLVIPRATIYYWLNEKANGEPQYPDIAPVIIDPRFGWAYEYGMTREQVEAICRTARAC